jgi:hypothetical protein
MVGILFHDFLLHLRMPKAWSSTGFFYQIVISNLIDKKGENQRQSFRRKVKDCKVWRCPFQVTVRICSRVQVSQQSL